MPFYQLQLASENYTYISRFAEEASNLGFWWSASTDLGMLDVAIIDGAIKIESHWDNWDGWALKITTLRPRGRPWVEWNEPDGSKVYCLPNKDITAYLPSTGKNLRMGFENLRVNPKTEGIQSVLESLILLAQSLRNTRSWRRDNADSYQDLVGIPNPAE